MLTLGTDSTSTGAEVRRTVFGDLETEAVREGGVLLRAGGPAREGGPLLRTKKPTQN